MALQRRCAVTMLVLAAIAASASASLEEACHGQATCEDIPSAVRASAMLQVKTEPATSLDPVNLQQSDLCAMPTLQAAHLEESRDCIPADLQEMHLKAVRRHAALLASQSVQSAGPTEKSKKGKSKPPPSLEDLTTPKPTTPDAASPDAASGAAPNGVWEQCYQTEGTNGGPPTDNLGEACSVSMGSDSPAKTGTCAKYITTPGPTTEFWCDVGQVEPCSALQPTQPCSFEGKDGVCDFKAPHNRLYCNIWPIEDATTTKKATTTYPGFEFLSTTLAPVTDAPTTTTCGTHPLNAAGFKDATSMCCPHDMEVFFDCLLQSLGYESCSWPHIQGLMHWFTCVPDMDFQYMLDVIEKGNPCKYWTKKGEECAVLTPECAGHFCR